jgi:hypothetical protein
LRRRTGCCASTGYCLGCQSVNVIAWALSLSTAENAAKIFSVGL